MKEKDSELPVVEEAVPDVETHKSTDETPENEAVSNSIEDEIEQYKNQIAEYKNKYIYLASEFDNYKRIAARDKAEYLANAGRDIMSVFLPILDDFDRAIKNDGVNEGILLIHQKMVHLLANEGLQKMETNEGDDFDVNLHHAIVEFAAPTPDLKGKVLNVSEAGYLFKNKILRHAKVVVGV